MESETVVGARKVVAVSPIPSLTHALFWLFVEQDMCTRLFIKQEILKG